MAFAKNRILRGDMLTAPAAHLRYRAAMMDYFAPDIGPYRAAHAVRRPAYADRTALMQVGTFGHKPGDMAETYIDRLL